MLTRLDIASTKDLTDACARHGVLFKDFGKEGATKPFSKLCANFEAGELEFWEDDRRLVYKTRRARSIILRKNHGKLEMLFEKRIFANGTVMEPSEKFSVSEKLNLLSGETALAGCVRGLEEELEIVGINPELFVFCEEYLGKIHKSRSYPGLWSQTHVTLYELMLPREFWKKKYIEPCGFCESHFLWSSVPADILRARKERKKKLAA